MLVVAEHVLVGDGTQGAQVPFCMMVLSDQVRRKVLPPGVTCRLLLPCSPGPRSFSLWEADDTNALAAYLANVPSQTFTLHVVEESGAFGLAEGGSVLSALEAARTQAGRSLKEWDTKYHVSDKAAAASHRACEAAREVDSKLKISESCASSWASVKAASASLASQAKAKLREFEGGTGQHQPLDEALLDVDGPGDEDDDDSQRQAFAGLRRS